MHVLDIVGQAGDQTAGRLIVKIGRDPGSTDGQKGPAADRCMIDWPIHSSTTTWQKVAKKNDHDQEPVLHRHPAESGNPLRHAQGLGHDVMIDPQLHQPGQTKGGDGDDQGQKHRSGQAQSMAPAVAENPPPEPGVADGAAWPSSE